MYAISSLWIRINMQLLAYCNIRAGIENEGLWKDNYEESPSYAGCVDRLRKLFYTYCLLIQACTTHVHRHNLVARAVHWYLCKHSWFSHNPLLACENRAVKWFFFHLHSISHHASNRPDIVLFASHRKRYIFGDSVLWKYQCVINKGRKGSWVSSSDQRFQFNVSHAWWLK